MRSKSYIYNDAKFALRLMVLVGVIHLLLAQTAHAAWQVATNALAQPASASTALNTHYFQITPRDVSEAIAQQLQSQGVEKLAQAQMSPGSTPVLYSADHPLKLVIHSLQVDGQTRRWQAQAYILAGGKTETVLPVSGTYTPMVEVPTLTRQLSKTDVIEASDIKMITIPDRQMRKDTIADAQKLIGQSPKSIISQGRPIRLMEVSAPIVIKKGDAVQMTYTSPYMSIRATGVALQDGAGGEMIRVKNDKSEKAVSGRVTAAGIVEMNMTPTL